MNTADKNYKENLKKLIHQGCIDKNPRAHYADGTLAHTLYLTQSFEKYSIYHGDYPIPTLRNTAVKTGFKEMLWIYQEQSNKLSDAHDLGIKWWDNWDIGDGTIGHRYGYVVNKYGLIDELLYNLQFNTFSRRHVIDLWQYNELNETVGLDPCAFMTMWTPREYGDILLLDLTLIQRSNDYIMAGYINKIQYVCLLEMVCSHLRSKGMRIIAGNFAHMVQNLHIYDRHIDAACEILQREPLKVQPYIQLPESKNFYKFEANDLKVFDNYAEKIKSPLEIAI